MDFLSGFCHHLLFFSFFFLHLFFSSFFGVLYFFLFFLFKLDHIPRRQKKNLRRGWWRMSVLKTPKIGQLSMESNGNKKEINQIFCLKMCMRCRDTRHFFSSFYYDVKFTLVFFSFHWNSCVKKRRKKKINITGLHLSKWQDTYVYSVKAINLKSNKKNKIRTQNISFVKI